MIFGHWLGGYGMFLDCVLATSIVLFVALCVATLLYIFLDMFFDFNKETKNEIEE